MKKMFALLLSLALIVSLSAQAENLRTATASDKGFASEVAVTLTADEFDRIVSVVIGDEKFGETPGFGARALEPEFAAQFAGKALPITVEGIDALSGATFTTNAVVSAINKAYAMMEPVPVRGIKENASFFFRRGIQWGMTIADVREREEGVKDQEAPGRGWTLGVKDQATVSLYTAELDFAFWNGQLNMIAYDFHSLGADDQKTIGAMWSYLTGALSTLYGQASDDNAALPTLLTENLSGRDPEVSRALCWETVDTAVYLCSYGPNNLCIIYINRGFDPAAAGIYNTYGL